MTTMQRMVVCPVGWRVMRTIAGAGLLTLVGWLPVQAAGPVIPAAHPRLLSAELPRLRTQFVTAPTEAAARFRGVVDYEVAHPGTYWGYSQWYTALAGVLTGTATYCTAAIAQTDAMVAAEEALIADGQPAAVAGDDYLEVGGVVGDIATVYDWCNTALSASQKSRWTAYANQAVWNVWNYESAQWGGKSFPWVGWSVDNPVDNYYFSFLRATMLWGVASKGENAQAQTWIDMFRSTKIPQLVTVYERDLQGGGSREGTGYGTAMNSLFFLYYVWEKTTGERIADLTAHTYASLPHLLHAIVPTLDRMAPIGDQSRDATASLFDYQRAYVLSLATLYRGDALGLARLGRAQMAASSVPQMGNSFQYIYDFLYDVVDTGPVPELNTAYWAPGTGFLFARSAWTTDATWLAQLIGPYTESHGHSDGLSFMLYKEGYLVSDEDIDSHSGLRQEQGAHALVTQRTGPGADPIAMIHGDSGSGGSVQVTALAKRNSYVYSAANVGTLFGDPSPVRSAREIVFIPPNAVVTYDRVSRVAGASLKTYQLPTPYAPVISGKTASWGNGKHTLKVSSVFPEAATVSSTTMLATTTSPDGGYYPDYNDGYRLDISITSTGESRFLNVLSIDNEVSSYTTTTGSDHDIALTLKDGRKVTLAFNANAPGGSIEVRDVNGSVLVSENLPSSIEAIAWLAGGARAPGAPTLLRLVAGHNQIKLVFQPPADDGGASIVSYTARCTGNGTTKSASGAASPLTVTGLTDGVRYTCSVHASNGGGAGSESSSLARVAGSSASLAPLLLILGD